MEKPFGVSGHHRTSRGERSA